MSPIFQYLVLNVSRTFCRTPLQSTGVLLKAGIYRAQPSKTFLSIWLVWPSPIKVHIFLECHKKHDKISQLFLTPLSNLKKEEILSNFSGLLRIGHQYRIAFKTNIIAPHEKKIGDIYIVYFVL